MSLSKALQLLSLLEKDELNDFKNFLASPYFNKSSTMVKLFGLIRDYHPNFDDKKLDKEKLARKLRPKGKKNPENIKSNEKDNNRLYIRNRLNELTPLVEEFLVVQQTRKNKTYYRQGLIEAMDDRNEYLKYAQLIQAKIAKTDEIEAKDWKTYHDFWWSFHHLYSHPANDIFDISTEAHAPKMLENFDQFSLLIGLRYICNKYARDGNIKDNQLPILHKAILEIAEGRQHQNPLVGFYFQIARLYQNFSPKKYNQLKTQFFENYQKIGKADQPAIWLLICNLTTSRLSNYEPDVFKILYQLYQFGAEGGIFLRNGKLSGLTFLNIAVLAYIHKDFQWAKNFIENNKMYLIEKIRHNVIELAYAYGLFHQKEFIEAYYKLEKIPVENFEHRWRTLSLKTRSLYELFIEDASYLKSIEPAIRSLKYFCNRVDGYNMEWKKGYFNFAKKVNTMLKYKKNPNTPLARWEELKAELSSLQPLRLKNWLLQKIQNEIDEK